MLAKCAFLVFVTTVFACGSDSSNVLGRDNNTQTSTSGAGGTITLGGGSTVVNPTGTGGGGSTGTVGQLTMVVRDFKFYDPNDPSTNPDFENVPTNGRNGWDDRGIVADQLGADHLPVYRNAAGDTTTTHGKASFDQWFRTVDKTNVVRQVPLPLVKNSDGTYSYDSRTAGPPLSPDGGFFPIDDGTAHASTFGNQGKDAKGVSHNFSFTVEIHTLFTYRGGEVFNFSGDDDVFVFIDNKLVIDLGGIHVRQQKNVSLDTLGLTVGKSYPLDFFYAERHVVESNLLITTSLELVTNPDVKIY